MSGYKLNTIEITTEYESIADYHSLRFRRIRDINPIKKQGCSGYEIFIYESYGEIIYHANIDAIWSEVKQFKSLREASKYIRKYFYKDK